MSKETARAQQLANDHWHGYNFPLLEAAGIGADDLELVGFAYKAALAHGYKHAIEDERAGLFKEVNLDAV